MFALKGALYGTSYYGGVSNDGTVFEVTKSGKERVLYSFKGGNDGAYPQAPLIAVKGKLYGTTSGTQYASGAFWGTVFSVTRSGKEHTLYEYKGPPNGATPLAGLIDLNGTLFQVRLSPEEAAVGERFSRLACRAKSM